MPDYKMLQQTLGVKSKAQSSIRQVYQQIQTPRNENGFKLLCQMLGYDPHKRIDANQALVHPYFSEVPKPGVKYYSTN
jgi:serine/threonine protein kinase